MTSSDDLSANLGDLFDTLRLPVSRQPRVHLPLNDDVGVGDVISMTWPCFADERLLGIVGLDIQLSDVVQDVAYFTSADGSTYAYMIDMHGKVYFNMPKT